MRQQCISAVEQAIGRTITQAEAKDIEDRISYQMRALAAKDPQAWRSLSTAGKLTQAAQEAAKGIVADAVLKKKRIALQIAAHDRVEQFVTAFAAANPARAGGFGGIKGGEIEGIQRLLVAFADEKANVESVERRYMGVRAAALSKMIETFDAADTRIFGLFSDPNASRELMLEIFGVNTGNATAKKGAKAWLDTAEAMRQQFNDAGGDVGKLADWRLPQHHSQVKVAKVPADKWVADTMPLIDRRRYFNEDGSPMSDQQIEALLRSSYATIATGGLNKITPGQRSGRGSRANAMNDSRVLHFKGADEWMAYQENYGEKSLYDVMVGHIETSARNIALVEKLGPNADATIGYFLDQAQVRESERNPALSGKVGAAAGQAQSLYDYVSGVNQPVASEAMARGFDSVRSWLVATRLGSAAIGSITDNATMQITAKVNNLPAMQLIRNQITTLNPANADELRLARGAGLAIDTMLGDLNRFGQDSLGPTFASKMASTVMRASFLPKLTDARKRAFGVTMMHGIGSLVQRMPTLASLDPGDNRILLSKGLTEADWQVLKLAQPEDWGNGNDHMLTPNAIMRIPDSVVPVQVKRDVMQKYLGIVLEETNMAVIEPGLYDRWVTGGGTVRGTIKGELVRSFFLFKSFPLAMIRKHWMRGMGQNTAGGRISYIASLMAATTVLGAVATTINDLLAGKNPRNYNPFEGENAGRNWMAALLKGGSLGIYGDFLFSGTTQYNTSPLAALQGPVFGFGEEFFNLTQGNLIQAAQGKDTRVGAEAVRFARGLIPGQNLWYAKAALDHSIFHQLQEYLSPGYLATMQRRSEREFGQSYYWTPGTGLDGIEAPELQRAIGE